MMFKRIPTLAPLTLCTFAGLVAAFSVVSSWAALLWVGLPDVTDVRTWQAPESVVIQNAFGGEMYRVVNGQDRTYLPRHDIPDNVRHAMIAIEDKRFYERSCIDVRAMTRAVLANVTDFKSQGASTITQQLVRTAFLTRDKTVQRKVRELLLACRIESTFSKDDVLNLYMNWISFGQDIYGIEQASRRYFGIHAHELSLPQAAILASLPQRPSYFSPYGAHRHTVVPDSLAKRIKAGDIRSVEDISEDDVQVGLLATSVRIAGKRELIGGRANQVLQSMEEQGYITSEERNKAEKELLSVTILPSTHPIEAPHFTLWVRDQVEGILENDPSIATYAGLKVETTLDPELQKHAEAVIAKLFPSIHQKYNANNIALVAMNRKTREIVAYVGNEDYFGTEGTGKIDMAQVPRQPGSSFKPFVYAASFLKGFTPKTIIQDLPIQIGKDRPRNYDNTFMGGMTIRKALSYSRNIPAIKAFEKSGGEQVVLDLITAMGAPTPQQRKLQSAEEGTPFDYGWPMALGTAETPLLEMVQAYGTLANSGTFLPAISVRSIQDSQGRVLYRPTAQAKQAMPAVIAGNITSILSDANSRPAGWWKQQLQLPNNMRAAVKTGTSNGCMKWDAKQKRCIDLVPNDTWALGYNNELVVGVWVGNADFTPLTKKADGLNVSVPVWKEFLVGAHAVLAKREQQVAATEQVVVVR